MRFRILLAILLVTAGGIPPAATAADERVPFVENTATVIAVDGLLIASKTDAFPYSLRVVGADPAKLKPLGGLIAFGTQDRFFRNVAVWVHDLGMKTGGDDRDKLKAHLAWEIDDLNQISHQKLTAQAEFLEINGRTWAHWTYDISQALSEKEKASFNAADPSTITQHYLTTVVRDYIIVLVTGHGGGPQDKPTLEALQDIAKTMVVYPHALTLEAMAALAQKPQPAGRR